jgi:hypothetical protein
VAVNRADVTFDEHGWHVEYVNGLQTAVARVQAILADDWDGDGGPVTEWTRLAAIRAALAGEQR